MRLQRRSCLPFAQLMHYTSRLMIRAGFLLLFFFTLTLCASADTVIDRLKSVRLSGGSYIRISDWAEAIRFETKWLQKGRSLEATSRWSRLIFNIGSAKAEMNGVRLWLSRAPRIWKGAAYISRLDLEKTIMPVLHPPTTRANQISTVCLDPGHGGSDPGNSEGRYREKSLTLELARSVRKKLEAAGLKVVMTRDSDKGLKLNSRPAVALKHKADLFISIHFNSAPGAGRSANGPEVYCLTPPGAASTNAGGRGVTSVAYPGNRHDRENALLAHQVQRALVNADAPRDRGVKRARFAVLRYAAMPAILVEAGFMSNHTELKNLTSSTHREKMARAIADGILGYKRTVERDD